ncbi:uncharacterized protein LOC123559058 [Mercenaria mercenaria]|uniref:uncharacterized protein LOC123559058 n=1 Tax=Mercenaria mercenaria TaxID=6596 RepID=UPI001E1D8177|nr:uncharacterized protein LOC123559058 [Mercenaria mercenaria]
MFKWSNGVRRKYDTHIIRGSDKLVTVILWLRSIHIEMTAVHWLLYLLWVTITVTSGAPALKTNSTAGRGNVPSKPNVPPIIKQCFYEGRWFPAGTIVNAGRTGDWCFGSYCDIDGLIKHWDDYNCPPPDKNNPNPPFPDLKKLQQQKQTTTTTTTTTTTPRPTRPPTIAPRTAPAGFWFPTTTQPFNFNFDQMGCFYRGEFYWAGQDIVNRRRGRMCMGTYCDFNGVLRHWRDDCRYTLPPPTRPPPTRPSRRRPQSGPVET